MNIQSISKENANANVTLSAWTVLFQKLKRQPPKASQIYALLDNPKTHRTEKVYLKLKYDSHGYPYFVPRDENIERGYRKTK